MNFNVNTESKDGKTVVFLKGNINEDSDLFAEIGDLSGEVIFNGKGVEEINSIGVNRWIKYFSKLQESGLKFSFEELTVPLVEQLNRIGGFCADAPILSFQVPYFCENCETENYQIMTSDMVKDHPPRVPCPNCGKESKFDDEEDFYFSFIRS